MRRMVSISLVVLAGACGRVGFEAREQIDARSIIDRDAALADAPPASCGNAVCEPEECTTCPDDCGGCPFCHDPCVVGEPMEAGCGGCVGDICAIDTFCCSQMWDVICVQEVMSICGMSCGD